MPNVPTKVPELPGEPQFYGALYPFVVLAFIFVLAIAFVVWVYMKDRAADRKVRSAEIESQGTERDLERQDHRAERESLVATIEKQGEQFSDAIEKHGKAVADALDKFSKVVEGCPHNAHYRKE